MPTDQDLQSIVRCFFAVKPPFKATPLASGNINDTFRVDFKTPQGSQSWLLQRLNHQVFTDPYAVMHNIQLVADHLSRQDNFPLQLLVPVPGLDSQLLQRDTAGNFWRMFPYFDHSYVPENRPDPEVAFEAARAYGIFLQALHSCPAATIRETIPGFHDTNKRWVAFQDVLEKDPARRVAATQAEIGQMHTARPVFDTIQKLKKTGRLPQRITHNDTKAGNVLLDSRTNQAIAVIDWDTIMPGTVLSDFGDMVRTFVPDTAEDSPDTPQLRKDVLQALCSGFLNETADLLSAEERNHLALGAAWIIGEQALRFLTDYLAGDVYYKIRHEEHNLVRARNQLALFRTVLEQLSTIERLINDK
ncbi:MAG: aminoglycoside phosphotransferase family protein [Bacteroidetes bacterium]|nr:MAG: aminoglycoside phosphotransferase family protein [Bacteroidota bacterium]